MSVRRPENTDCDVEFVYSKRIDIIVFIAVFNVGMS